MKIALLLISAVLFAGSAMAEPLKASGQTVISASIANGQSGLGDVWSCSPDLQAAYDASGLPKGESFETLRAIDRVVRAGIRYREDETERWSDFSAEVLAGNERPIGDCEDYALTSVRLALCAGIPAERLGVAMSHKGGGRVDITRTNHAFAIHVNRDAMTAFGDNARNRPERLREKTSRVTFWQTVDNLRTRGDLYHVSGKAAR